MKKKILMIVSYVLVAVVAASTTALCFMVDRMKSGDKLDEVRRYLSTCFIGDLDMDEVEDSAAGAMVQALGDEWSYYMTAEQYTVHQEDMSNSYVGIGITVMVRQDGKGIDITQVTEGSPAQAAGLKQGDVVTAVGDTSTAGAELSEVSSLVRGEEGTTVELTVLRDGQSLTFQVERKRFETPVATYELLEDGIGLITIVNFDDRCSQETIAAVEALREQGAQALIFDVRNNPGGYKHELVEVLDYLLPEGPLFRTEDYLGREEVDESDADCVDMSMAVLMNLHSYSAAEFFAAALDEYDAAVTVGEKTYGKGYMQVTFPLSDGSAVNLSIGKYYTPNGESLAGVGLQPDVELVVDEETAAKIAAGSLAPEEDPQIQAAVEALKDGK